MSTIEEFSAQTADITAFTSNPNSPAYQCDSYRRSRGKLQFVADMFTGRSAWYAVGSFFGETVDPIKANLYLPQESEEPDEEYNKRLSRSYFVRRFRNAIESFAGFLSSFTLVEGTDPSIVDAQQNIDLKGNSLEVFFRAADQKALRDERCFILVEFPKPPKDKEGNPLIKSALDERKFGLRPYLVLIDVRDVVNWKLAPDNRTIMQVTIRETVTEDIGLFGSKQTVRYRVLFPGGYTIYTEQDGAYVVTDGGFTSLDRVPLVSYSLTNGDIENRGGADPFSGEPPLYDLAELNLKHYQKTSEKDEAMHKCNMAVLQVEELNAESSSSGETPTVRIGPNTCLWNVRASFVEPSGAAIAATQADIERLEMNMDSRTLSFLSGSEVQRTATEVSTFSGPVQANLGSMARAKQSKVQSCFELWSQYSNAKVSKSGIYVDEKILQSAIDSGVIGVLLQMRQAKEVTRATFLSLLKKGKAFPKDFDVEAEVKALEKEEQLQAQAMAVLAQKIP
ncbi:62kDa structural protein [Nostoc flagelliforme CCNUN1]|uniref:62kDa structural protein n=1 Tax=Nostoc flagelliforme CCNUN1 TaxID=2038116 RepID=A0A2K8SL25_9NOSO|nr:DUF4055 domain-containing protein [Nostoc flagelliforme]AUB36141.1 62kDa structural protein [Nostoc flagelliforme CCNUN1]